MPDDKTLIGYDTRGAPVYRGPGEPPRKTYVTITKDDLTTKHGRTIADTDKAREREKAEYQRGGPGRTSTQPAEKKPPVKTPTQPAEKKPPVRTPTQPAEEKPPVKKYPTRGSGGEVFTAAELKQFKSDKTLSQYKVEGGGYDLVTARRAGVKDETLKSAGFSDNTIKQVNDIILASKQTGVALPGEESYLYRGKDITADQRNKMIKDYETKRDNLIKQGKMFTAEWQRLGEHPANSITVSAPVGKRKLISGAEWVFPPAKALKPEYKKSDVTGLEWALGGANVVLIAAPYISAPLKGVGAAINVTKAGVPIKGATTAYKAGIAALQAGAGGVYTAATVDGIKSGNMKPHEIAFSVLIDTAILAAAFVSATGAVRSLRAPKQGVFKFDFSKKANTITGNSKVGAAVEDIQAAVVNRDPLQLKEAARRLELAGREVPPELKPALQKQARLIEANADDFINLTKEKPKPGSADILEKGIKANEKHLDLLDKQLRKTKNPNTKKAIEEAIKETRKSIATQTATKTKPLVESVRVVEPGKNLPARVASKQLAKIKEKIKVGNKSIPVREFADKTGAQIARKYKVSPSALIWAVSNLPVSSKRLISVVNPEVVPYPIPENLPSVEPDTKPQAKGIVRPGVKTGTKPGEESAPAPAEQPAPQPAPAPTPKRTQVTTEKPEPAPGGSTTTTPTPGAPTPALTTPTPGKPTKLRALPQLPKLETDKQKREFIVNAGGAFCWRGGELHGKDIWHVVVSPYKSNEQYMTVKGDPPAGATIMKRGVGSAYATAQMTRGNPPRHTVRIDQGFQDITVKTISGRKIRMEFRPDPKGLTRGNITIGRNKPVSTKVGKIYHTKIGNNTLLSRRPLGRKRR